MVTARLDALDGASLSGIIDRLVMSENSVHVVDYKTNRIVPDQPDQVPLGILQQMAAYGDAVTKIYPSRDIHLHVLWTKTASEMEIPLKMVRSVLQTAPRP